MACVGEAASERKRMLTSLDAPDFTLPDLDGKMHSLVRLSRQESFRRFMGVVVRMPL